MKGGPALENLTGAIIEICRSGLLPEELRDRVLSRLRRVVPFDAAFWATVDPATLLFTQPHQQDIGRLWRGLDEMFPSYIVPTDPREQR
jgi:hypothetical protein